jgi:hypothetical protein
MTYQVRKLRVNEQSTFTLGNVCQGCYNKLMKKQTQKTKGKKPTIKKPQYGTEKGEIQVIFFKKTPYSPKNEKQ